MKKVLFLYSRGGQIVTGGQKYEDRLFRGLQGNVCFEAERFRVNKIHGSFSKLFSPLVNLSLLKRLRGYDLIVLNSVEGYYFLPLVFFLRGLMGKTILIIHHHFLHEEFAGMKRVVYRCLEYSFLRSASLVVTPSPYIEALCRIRFPKKTVRLWQIPFDRPAMKTRIDPQKGELLFVGTIEPRKGLVYLMRALSILRRQGTRYHLTIIGKVVDDCYLGQLETMIEENELDVTFAGFVSAEEKEEIMSRSDVFVFPSLLEGYGMVLCEAMINGLPVICFDNSAMPYTVKSGQNGLVVPNRDASALAGAIFKIVDNRQLQAELSRGAIASAAALVSPDEFKDFTNKQMCEILNQNL